MARKAKAVATRRADELRTRLESEIASGELGPGTRLDETRLAERFGVSRTPVREALQQLSTAGLVELRPRQGAVVAAMTVQQLLQMFEVMAELEALCARLAARRITPEQRKTLSRSHATCGALAETRDPEAYYDENRHFHEVIYAASQNAYLQNSTRVLRNRLQPYRRFQLNHPGRIDRSLAEHDAVVKAILEGDGERAAAAMRDHVTIQGDLFTDLISSLPPSYLQTGTG